MLAAIFHLNLQRSRAGRALPARPAPGRTSLRLETMEHGGEYPDTMPQAIKLIDAVGQSCVYVPITQDSKVVDSQGFMLEDE
jgi:hypothetical protein